jgi:hypothetical protein
MLLQTWDLIESRQSTILAAPYGHQLAFMNDIGHQEPKNNLT